MHSATQFDRHQQTVIVESTLPLTSQQLTTIISNIKLDPQYCQIVNRPNPALIAGLRVITAGKIIDLSLQYALNQLTDQSHE